MAVRSRKKLAVGQELDMKPFVNFMVLMILALIVSVEFAKIAIIDMKLPEGRGSQTKSTVAQATQEDESNKLLLTAVITDSVVTLGAKGGFLPSLFYKEFHKYNARETGSELTVEYKKGQKVIDPKNNKELTIFERSEIMLYVTDEEGKILNTLYTKKGEMLTNYDGQRVAETKAGDTIYTVTNPRHMIIVSNPAEFKLVPMSAYDELKNRLMKVKERFQDADDVNDIIIAAENEVMYDKIVQIMDVARSADFPNISIAKLRG
jgi:biopolymer transport protein ExbD